MYAANDISNINYVALFCEANITAPEKASENAKEGPRHSQLNTNSSVFVLWNKNTFLLLRKPTCYFEFYNLVVYHSRHLGLAVEHPENSLR